MTRLRPDPLYFGALVVLAAGMPHANLLMSIGTILLVLIWLFTGGYSEKFRLLRKNLPALLLMGLFVLHLIWLFNTSDFDYAFKDLRVKLPLLVLPLVLGSIPISKRSLHRIFIIFSISCGVAIVRVCVNYLLDPAAGNSNPRQLVQGISHIRLSLMMVLMVVYLGLNYFRYRLPAKILATVAIVGAFLFFHLLQSITGSVILIITLVVLLIVKLVKINKPAWGFAIGIVALLTIAVSLRQLDSMYRHYFTTTESLAHLPEKTEAGNLYTHYKHQLQVENGSYVWMYINYDEMTTAWNARSNVSINFNEPGTDTIEACLIRYLTSKGLRKDKTGIAALDKEDIAAIERGVPSLVYRDSNGLMQRLHKILFDVHLYLVYNDPSGNSVSQRLAYWKTGAAIFMENPVFGVGTGDVPDAFNAMYEKSDLNLKPQFWRRTHNQFLTFFLTFGVVGGLYFVLVFFVPYRYQIFRSSLLWTGFICIAFLSCLTEDTLETQAGVTFFAFFYMLLVNKLWFQPQFSTKAQENLSK